MILHLQSAHGNWSKGRSQALLSQVDHDNLLSLSRDPPPPVLSLSQPLGVQQHLCKPSLLLLRRETVPIRTSV